MNELLRLMNYEIIDRVNQIKRMRTKREKPIKMIKKEDDILVICSNIETILRIMKEIYGDKN